MKTVIIFIGILMFLTACHAQHNSDVRKSDCKLKSKIGFDINTIIAKQKQELRNVTVYEYFRDNVREKIDLLTKSKQDKYLLFPFTEVDSVIYLSYEDIDEQEEQEELTEEYPDNKVLRGVILCKKKINAILNLVNDPNNFNYEECGIKASDAQIKFYKTGKEVAQITFSCGHGQITCTPTNILTNFGVLNNSGYQKLVDIAPWE